MICRSIELIAPRTSTMIRVFLLALLSSTAFGQTAGESPAFEFVDVHASPPSTNPTMRGGTLNGGRFEIRTATIVDLISESYTMPPERILGGPNWLDWDRFDVIAKTPSATRQGLELMMQKMLADRFKLVLHKDTRPVPAMVLTVKNGKPMMKAASGSGESGCRGVPQNQVPGIVPYQVISCQNVTMTYFANILNGYGGGSYLADPVVDLTGLEGTWDFELKWTARNRLAQAGPDGISLFDAVDKQLGLKLESQKTPQPVLMVDSVNEIPTPNDPSVTAKIPPPPPTEFEVASIKPTPADVTGQSTRLRNGRVDLQNYTLRQMIQLAWGLNNNEEMLVGLPKSADTNHYDVAAKVATSGAVNAQDLDFDTLQVMLRGLLANRFGLKVHMEDRPVTAYTLTATAQTKLQKANPEYRTNCKAGSSTQNPLLNRLITCQNMNMKQFAVMLESMAGGYVRAPIKDATGLEGYWDFSVNFSGINLLPGAQFDPNASSGAADPNGSLSLPEALQKQLGLKLQLGKRPIPVLVVDHAGDKPTGN
jgi:uncharacterized protein (TIGR03435 family)